MTTPISPTFLGIDLGTSELKAILMASSGTVLATAHAPLGLAQVHPGWSEQDPAQWWQALLQACQSLAQQAPQAYAAVQALGLSGQMHGATLLGAQGQVLRPCILWNDTRSAAQCQTLRERLPSIEQITGNLVMPGFTAPKLLWIQEHEPHVFQALRTVLLPKDYLRYLLTGEFVSDMSDAAGTLWLNVAERDWSDAALAACGLTRAHMPRLVEACAASGTLSAAVAAQLGLPSSVVVAGGAGDNAASAMGMGVVEVGDAFISLGTSGVVFCVTDQHRPNVHNAVHAFCHALPQTWHQMTVMLSAASCLRWVTQLTGAVDEAALLAQVALLSTADQAQAPLFLPYLSGERTPHNDATASGVFMGLRPQHGSAHLAYAVLEGVGFGLRDGLQALQEAGSQIRSAQLVGGGARSTLWAQLLADVLEIEVTVSGSASVGAALGAARLALLALSAQSPARIAQLCSKPPVDQRYTPQPGAGAQHAQRYAQYRACYAALQPVFQRAA